MNSPALWDLCHTLLDKIGWPPNLSYNNRRFYHPERSVPLPDDLAACAVRCWIEDWMESKDLLLEWYNADGSWILSCGRDWVADDCHADRKPCESRLHALVAAGMKVQP